jgi:hypothetical protein
MKMNRAVMIVLGVLLVIVVAAGSFYGGMVYGKNHAETTLPIAGEGGEFPGPRGQFGQRGSQVGAEEGQLLRDQSGMLFGEIQSIGDGELTVTDANGEQITVYVAGTTLIQKQAEVTLADLEEGETVIISGNRDDDGNITARSLQVTTGGGMFGQPGAVAPGGE